MHTSQNKTHNIIYSKINNLIDFFLVTFLHFFVLIFLFEYFLDFCLIETVCVIPLSAAYILDIKSIFVITV